MRNDPASAELLRGALELLERAAVEAPLAQGERAYLTSTASRLRALADSLEAGERPGAQDATPPAPAVEELELPKPPRKLLTRKEAAAVVGVHSNTLLNWEARGLLRTQRDYRGWRVYGREELARAMALAAHIPLADMPSR